MFGSTTLLRRRIAEGFKTHNSAAVAFVSGFVTCSFVFSTLIRFSIVRGRSMFPSLQEGDVIIVRGYGRPDRGDVVTCSDPVCFEKNVVKRLIALEGDVVKRLRAPLSNSPPEQVEELDSSDALESVMVPPNACWVEGDNHPYTLDSNEYGPVIPECCRELSYVNVT